MALTSTARKKIGDVGIHKGSLVKEVGKDQEKVKIPLAMWDVIPECDDTNCPIADLCDFDGHGKCEVRTKYMTHVVESVLESKETFSAVDMLQIGMSIVPLYSQLVRFKMESATTTVTYTTSRGVVKIDPIFAEIRNTIKLISDLLRNVGVAETDQPSNPQNGDGDYYDTLFEVKDANGLKK